MDYYATDEALRLIREHDERADFCGGVSKEEIARAEERLGVGFPPSYRRFLEELGAGHFGPQSFFGLCETGEATGVDVVAYTFEQRDHGNLPTDYIVVGHFGEEAFVGINCADRGDEAECPVAKIPRDWNDIQEPNFFDDDFGAFMLRRVRDILGEHEQMQHP